MSSAPDTCPVTGQKTTESGSKCPAHAFLEWCRQVVSLVIPTLPFRVKNDDFETIIKHACSFCALLIHYKPEIQEEVLERIPLQVKDANPQNRDDALSKIFLNFSKKSNGVFSHDFGIILAHTLIDYTAEFHKSCENDLGNYMRILSNYQLGIQVTYDIWRDVIIACRERYGRLPTPEELTKYHPFVLKFVHTIGQLPGLFAVPLRDNATSVHVGPNLIMDESGTLGLVDDHIRKTKIRIFEELEILDADQIEEVTTNRHCPALPMLTKIAQMCCEIFNKAYAEVYHQYEQ